ncbi:MAG: hypothetical protein HY589_03565 [Candidatus Omnitrophica bacterium]|nr:hypothetical protein [Candidatus Omnitrophota bacterium]
MPGYKKIFDGLIFLSIFCLAMSVASVSAYAAAVGNTADTGSPKGPGLFTLRQDKDIPIKVGGDLEFVFDRDIDASSATDAEISSAEWYMAKISYVMFNRIEPYVKLGVAHMKTRWTEAGANVKVESDTNFAWGVGGKVLIWDFKTPKLKLITDGVYRIADMDVEDADSGGSKVNLDTAASRFLIREWQVSLLAATEIDVAGPSREDFLGISTIVPYAGIKYSDINGRLRVNYTSGNFNNPGTIESDSKFGVFAGCDFVGPNSVSLNVEGRFLDETALSTGLSVLF